VLPPGPENLPVYEAPSSQPKPAEDDEDEILMNRLRNL